MFKETILPIVLIVLVVVAVAFAITGVYLWDFSGDCTGNGGTFSIEGGTAWCRY